MKVGFARVSTKEQDLNIQLSKLDAHGCEKIFQGKQSGASIRNEEKLKELIDFIREGDEVIVTRLDRLGRSLKSILEDIESTHKRGDCSKIINGSVSTKNDNPFTSFIHNLRN